MMARKTTGKFTRLLRTDAEYERAVREIDRLLDQHPDEGSPADERIAFLSLLVEEYDRAHHDLPGPDAAPRQVVEYLVEAQDVDRGTFARIMGGRSRVSEFLNGKRALSLGQVYALRELLDVPADLLLDPPRAGSRVAERTTRYVASTRAKKTGGKRRPR